MRHIVDFWGLFRASPYACAVLATNRVVVEANPAYLTLLDRSPDQLIGHDISDHLPAASAAAGADMAARYLAAFDAAVQHAQRTHEQLLFTWPRADSHAAPLTGKWQVINVPLLDEAGEVAYIAQHMLPMPEPSTMAASRGARWRDQVDRMRRLFEHAPMVVGLVQGRRHICVFLNAAGRELFGQRQVIGLPLLQAVPELEGQNDVRMLDEARLSGVPQSGKDICIFLAGEVQGPDERFFDLLIQPVLSVGGRVSSLLLMGHDVTEYRRTRDTLTSYRDRLEELVEQRTRALRVSENERQLAHDALLQSRKMEAVGKLTGGVAHDFNNVLQIIGGNLQLLAQEELGPVASRRLQIALTALARGRKLTEQLLTFARKQPLTPTAIDLAELLANMRDLLLHAVGEDIRLEVVLAPGLWHCHADPHHLGNVLLNLVINARDAIEGTGTVTISADNLTLTPAAMNTAAGGLDRPGPYVGIVVSDTGRGMSAITREQAFEPFFTTKESGRGTGLGLSLAYSFISQSGGGIRIDSEEGKGTAVSLYLPRVGREETEAPQASEETVTVMAADSQVTLLVVEDDPAVRATAVDMLTHLGYQVLMAADAEKALEMLRCNPDVQLLFIDVVLPGKLSSTELAIQAMEISPDIEILYTSGHDPSHARYPVGIRQEVLSKPHQPAVLSQYIRHALRNREQRLLFRRSTGKPRPVGRAGTPLHILLVEDQDDTRDTCADLLRTLDHQVVTVAHGEEAVEMLAQLRFDVLCTDIGLPGMSGIELAQHARKLDPHLAIVFATGYGALDPKLLAELGASVVIKPFGLDAIQQMLETLRTRG